MRILYGRVNQPLAGCVDNKWVPDQWQGRAHYTSGAPPEVRQLAVLRPLSLWALDGVNAGRSGMPADTNAEGQLLLYAGESRPDAVVTRELGQLGLLYKIGAGRPFA